MKKYFQIGLLGIATILGFYTSIFGAREIATFFSFLQPDPVTSQDALLRVALFLISTFFAEALWERMTTFNQIDEIESAIKQINPKQLNERIDRIDNMISEKVRPYFDRYLPGGTHSLFHELFIKYSFRGVAVLEKPTIFTVNRGNSLNLWKDCLIEADSWNAISYATDLWTNNDRLTSMAHQQAHTSLDGTISRVFVFDDEDEKVASDGLMKELAQLPRTEVKWILKDELYKQINKGAPHINRPDFIDFAIIDPANVILWFRLLDGTKELTGASLSIFPTDVNDARRIFAIALGCSTPVKVVP